jgi:hypothetical protein
MNTKYTKLPQEIPNYHKIYQMATKYTKWPQEIPNYHKMYQMATRNTKFTARYTKMTISRPVKFYQNLDLGVKICIPSGNPVVVSPPPAIEETGAGMGCEIEFRQSIGCLVTYLKIENSSYQALK